MSKMFQQYVIPNGNPQYLDKTQIVYFQFQLKIPPIFVSKPTILNECNLPFQLQSKSRGLSLAKPPPWIKVEDGCSREGPTLKPRQAEILLPQFSKLHLETAIFERVWPPHEFDVTIPTFIISFTIYHLDFHSRIFLICGNLNLQDVASS